MTYKAKTNGVVIYRGLSEIDHKTPIVAIATGLIRPSSNPKTGPMVQVWILRADINPHEAATTGQDIAICNGCPLAKLVDKQTGESIRNKRCYVNTAQAPSAIYEDFQRGSYDTATPQQLTALGSNRSIRLGAYGDPVAVPYRIWSALIRNAKNWTGYSHSWRIGRFWRFRRILMASCETYADHQLAKAKGWRTFQTGSELGPDQIYCPSSQGITCEQCGLCKGSAIEAKSIVIPPHGGAAVMKAWNQPA